MEYRKSRAISTRDCASIMEGANPLPSSVGGRGGRSVPDRCRLSRSKLGRKSYCVWKALPGVVFQAVHGKGVDDSRFKAQDKQNTGGLWNDLFMDFDIDNSRSSF